ncbi:hypothetical protein FOL47_002134 [Perkinsus chesapeaki]|uniref:Glutathione S-transferase kappa 1 n=1 Tax=Perkinsus chesapeaki TaxID=330153 RepID=A0A7J6MF26_PERCH|nr:hypothetical protein FOL47_002134 [Perkinsus chesapeaki]
MVPPGKIKVEFFYDVVSPYTYLAWQTLKQYRTIWDLEVVLRPVFLGGIMKGSGNRPPAVVPNKSIFMMEDLKRAAHMLKVPLLPVPTNFFSQVAGQILQVQRLLAAAPNAEIKEKLTESAFRALWEDRSLRDFQNNFIEINNTFLQKLCKDAGLSTGAGDALIEESKSVGKADLMNSTKEAIEKHHIFGSPSFVVHVCGKVNMFFGGDRVKNLCFHWTTVFSDEYLHFTQPGVNNFFGGLRWRRFASVKPCLSMLSSNFISLWLATGSLSTSKSIRYES